MMWEDETHCQSKNLLQFCFSERCLHTARVTKPLSGGGRGGALLDISCPDCAAFKQICSQGQPHGPINGLRPSATVPLSPFWRSIVRYLPLIVKVLSSLGHRWQSICESEGFAATDEPGHPRKA